ncbi:exonuclease SbcCD subunit D [Methylomonas rapida]|uniref:Nuclease SbcCD subunit D n=1 Tax=Methylomonas rapida TaxID=2963939 RepID=A0ABY7GJE1_9GAMM|nr:exonuclease SbcCD subunit D [Methylomonas rapida]WAR44624.1 exonuclease SbcCD subunit D [Methylomonas rapida]
MKFIHTSDWHIGRQFHNVSLLEDQRHVLNQLIEHIEREAVDAVVIAGDIYDRSVPPAAAVELLDDVLNKICAELGVPVLLIPGNHDSAERLRFASRQLRQAGLHIIGELSQINQPVKIRGASIEVCFYGIPYNDPELVRNHFGVNVSTHDEAHRYLVEQIISAKPDESPSILISHCFIDGWDESDSERPLSIGGADRINYEAFTAFDYVALGHLHSPQHKGESHIRYSGSILKYSFSEQKQRKGITLVEMAANGMKSATHLPLHPLRDMRILEGELNTLLEQGKTDPHNDDYLLVRLTDKHALLDPMGKLRQVYPNVLHIEKPGMLDMSDQAINRDKLKRGELEMFRDFFEQVHGQALLPEQDEAIKEIISQIQKLEGELA